MKKILFLFAITAMSFHQLLKAQDTLPNPGFENWINSGVYDDPVGWNTGNSIVGNFIQTVQKSSDASEGLFSLKMVSTYFALGGVTIPGIATTGSISLDANFNPTFSGGTPFNKVPIALTGMFKHLPANAGDTAAINITLTKYDAINDTFLVIGMGGFFFADTVDTWTPFTIPIIHILPMLPDTMLVLLSSSNSATPPQGGTLWVDDLGFSWAAGITYPDNELNVVLFPHPASDILNVSVAKPENGLTLLVYNLLGETVIQTEINGLRQQVDVSTLQKGMYLYQLKNENGQIKDSGKFQISR